MKTYRILKNISVKLDDTYMMILSYMYHSNKQQKESEYRFEAVIDTIDNFKSKLDYYKNHIIDDWVWFNSDLKLSYNKGTTNRMAANWIAKRISGALDWETFLIEISKEWRDNGWVSTGYYNSTINNLDLKNTTPSFLIGLTDKSLHLVFDSAISIKPKYI